MRSTPSGWDKERAINRIYKARSLRKKKIAKLEAELKALKRTLLLADKKYVKIEAQKYKQCQLEKIGKGNER